MEKNNIDKDIKIQLILFLFIASAMMSSPITASKPVHLFLEFPFTNITFALFTFPIIDAICELYGKKQAYFVSILGVLSQFIFMCIIEVSIITPYASAWHDQDIYAKVLSKSYLVVLGTIVAFVVAQFMDVYVFQYIKNSTKGKKLWLRSGVSSIIGQFVDSIIFINIVYWNFPNKYNFIMGAFFSKSILCIMAIPITYLIVFLARKYNPQLK